jgi:bifunctional UDP-N-acetylglucosamine pyrophosphorylase/glucosamine-1-phosphate N-acetyltransferase
VSLAALVMAAGRGTRLGAATSKPLQDVCGRPMVEWVIDAVRGLDPERLIVVSSPATRNAFGEVEVVVQEKPLGTADAVASAREALGEFVGDLLVLAADTPLVRTETLERVLAEHRRGETAVTILSFESADALPYGRVVRGPEGELRAIVEEADAPADERAISELNSSVYVFAPQLLWSALDRLDTRNAQRELQLTSAVREIVAGGGRGAVYRSPDAVELRGVNTPADLTFVSKVLRQRLLLQD